MRLLLAEDDPALGADLKARLQQAGYAVDWAEDGLTAYDLGSVEAYDAIILDLGLPGRGWRCCASGARPASACRC